MSYYLFLILLVTIPSFVLSCKSNSRPPCPEGYWQVPDGWKCNGGDMTDCANHQNCMNFAYLCDGKRNLRRENEDNNSDLYLDGSPDENLCTDEFCATLNDGRIRRCPGTTRCIIPTKNNFSGTDTAIGQTCGEELFSQFEAVNFEYVNDTTVVLCDNGEKVRVENYGYEGMFLKSDLTWQCRVTEKPYCSGNFLTSKICAWACLHYNTGLNIHAWACPGDAKCIKTSQICDGIPDCSHGQDEDELLCTEDFCKNGFVTYDNNEFNFTTKSYNTDPSKIIQYHIFSDYRYPYFPENHMDDYRKIYATDRNGKVNIASLQNLEMPKCRNSTKCLRRNRDDEDVDKLMDC